VVAHRFERTVCACTRCVACCEKPGPLAPGDLERIVAHTGMEPDQVPLMFWASPGSTILDKRTQQVRVVGSITPQTVNGRCVFQQHDGRCGIHPVAPFGCAYFDMHQPPVVYMPRSAWLAEANMDPDYQALRANLPPAPAKVRTCGTGDIAW
jgi:Fe-S-cluster containining protein